MGNTPFFITNDLESTASVSTDALSGIRSEALKAINKALRGEVKIRVITHDEGVKFFSEKRQDNEFVIATDGGIYIQDPDFSFESTRMFPDENSILTNTKSYKILTREGKPLEDQGGIFISPEKIENVGLYDDGLFSGDTIKAVLSTLPNGVTKYRVNVLLNFSGQDTIGNMPINALYSGDCVDWIDERDFFYGVKNSGASINPNGVVSGVPYISSPRMVSKKASIPENTSKEFCLTMLGVNKKLWAIIDENAVLEDIPRLRYLLATYNGRMSMQDVLEAEMRRIESL